MPSTVARRAAAVLVCSVALAAPGVALGRQSARAATVTVSYDAGHRGVVINGYGTPALGSFVLHDGVGDRIAFCLEADRPHTTVHDAYRGVASEVASPELDYLLWRHAAALDDDTATAVAALVWYHARARRDIGGLVWADTAAGWSAISPVAPVPWDRLGRFTLAHPVGVRAGGAELDHVERLVHRLHVESVAHRPPWDVTAPHLHQGRIVTEVSGPGGPIGGLDAVRLVVTDASGRVVAERSGVTDAAGRAEFDVADLPAGGRLTVAVDAPGPHQEWDGDGRIQRLATGTAVRLEAAADLAPATTTTVAVTTSTTTEPAASTTSSPPTTAPPMVPPSTTEPVPPSTTTAGTTTSTTVATTTAPPSTVPAGTVAPTTESTSTTAVAAAPPPPASPMVATPRALPHTGRAGVRRLVDVATVVVTAGLLLVALATAWSRRTPPRRDLS